MNLDFYEPTLRYKSSCVISGQIEEPLSTDAPICKIPIVAAFLADDDITEMTIVSSNIGFVKTLRKVHRRKEVACE